MTGTALTLMSTAHNLPAPLIERLQNGIPQLAAVLGDEGEARRALTNALVAIQRNGKLAEADPDSFLLACMTVAQWGLEVGTTAHLVPFYSSAKRTTMVTPIADYKGMIALAIAAKSARSIEARAVFEGEQFEVFYGSNAGITHAPDFGKRGDPRKITHVYAIARLGFNRDKFEVMDRAAVERRRGMSKNASGDIWNAHYEAMAKKTVIRELCKTLPQSPRLSRILVDEDHAEMAALIETPDGTLADAETGEVQEQANAEPLALPAPVREPEPSPVAPSAPPAPARSEEPCWPFGSNRGKALREFTLEQLKLAQQWLLDRNTDGKFTKLLGQVNEEFLHRAGKPRPGESAAAAESEPGEEDLEDSLPF